MENNTATQKEKMNITNRIANRVSSKPSRVTRVRKPTTAVIVPKIEPVKPTHTKIRMSVNYSHPIDCALTAFNIDINNSIARTIVGLLIAGCIGIIPIACFISGHEDLRPMFHGEFTTFNISQVFLVIAFVGGLVFSATKVSGFINKALSSASYIGWGAALLIELSMTFTSNVGLAYGCLGVLVFFNVISAASTLAKR